MRSPYLLGVGAWVSLLSFGATIIYFEQANIVSAAIHGAAANPSLRRHRSRGGPAELWRHRSLPPPGCSSVSEPVWRPAALPAIYIVGFAALASDAEPFVVVTLQVAQRWMNFAIANPARQVSSPSLAGRRNIRPRTLSTW